MEDILEEQGFLEEQESLAVLVGVGFPGGCMGALRDQMILKM